MKKKIILITVLSIFSCKKNINSTLHNTDFFKERSSTYSSVVFKPIGKPDIKKYDFPRMWNINIYNDENIKLEKRDIVAQNKFQEINYFNEANGNIVTSDTYLSCLKKDNILKLSKIDSSFIIDTYSLDKNKKVIMIKTLATLDEDNYEIPVKIYRLDLILSDQFTDCKAVNLYSEIDYPYFTTKTICYLDSSGNLYCKKFEIDEDKTYYKGSYHYDLKK